MSSSWWHDVRLGVRMLLRNPGFTLSAILSIAVGVGMNVGMFSVSDGLVLRPLPVRDPARVVRVSAFTDGAGFRNPRLSYPDYVDLRDGTATFEGLTAYRFVSTSLVAREGEPAQRKFGMAISGNLFDVMGVMPMYGRAFRLDEDQVSARDLVVILDHDEWQRTFAADPGVVGRSIRVAGVAFDVVGIAPPAFTGDRFRCPSRVLHPAGGEPGAAGGAGR